MYENLGPGEMPEEVTEKLRAAMEHMRLHRQTSVHMISGLLNELTSAQLEVLEGLMIGAASDTHYATHILGRITSIRELKFHECPCGEDHNPADLLGAEQSVEEDVSKSEESPADRLIVAGEMIEYGLVERGGTIRCKNCNLEYVSVEDRMLRPPGIDGCHGCQMKSSTGSNFE